MSFRIRSISLLLLFVTLAAITSNMMWELFGWRTLAQIILILSVAVIGENIVSSQGYYHYPRHVTNGPFVRNIPLWIVFLWVFSVQASLLVSLFAGLEGLSACLMSGLFTSITDLIFFEPLMSRMMQLWHWTPVENGHFKFIPTRLHRFTAPPGNYITWLVFPVIANCFLGFLMIFV